MGARYIGFLAGSLLGVGLLGAMLQYDVMRKDELINARMAALEGRCDAIVGRFEGIRQSI